MGTDASTTGAKAQQQVQDAWRLTLRAPQSAHSWHRLFAHAQQISHAEQANLSAAVHAAHFPDPWSAFLAATFAHGLTKEPGDLARAAEIFMMSDLPSECGLAVMNTTQAQALKSCTSAREMHEVFERSGLPRLSHAIGARLTSHESAKSWNEADGTESRRHAVVVTPVMSLLRQHAPTQMAVAHARQLQRMGWQVSMAAAQEFSLVQMESWLGTPRAMVVTAPRAEELAGLRTEMPVYLPATGLAMDTRWRALAGKLREIRPEVVVFVGLCSPLLSVLFRDFPIVGLPTNTGLVVAGPHDVALIGETEPPGHWSGLHSPIHYLVHTRRFEVALAPAPRSRDAIGIPTDATMWLTSGTRLNEEMRPSWTSRVLQMLEVHPAAHWAIVGLSAAQQSGLKLSHPRLHFMPYDADLASLVSTSDIYLAPPRIGGGASVCMAMAHGVAIVAPRNGDAGHKLGPHAPADEDACFAVLDLFTRDSGARAAQGRALLDRFNALYAAEDQDTTLGRAIEMAREVAERRLYAIP